ncbi:MAG TPA: type IV toxin-antitoxin system AbiEi family antitoxin domain-containing protein [bacterium]|nr:type IV toxin-antitoxin system AbiEi family antitoxin domain-containing protein [bacterium]
MTKTRNAFQKAKDIFCHSGGILRTKDALKTGIQPRTLYAMRDAGLVEKVSRGLYRLPNIPPIGNPDLVTVALRIPEAVICLISALTFFEVTTQVPHEVHIARIKGAEPPRLVHPPVRVFWFSRKAFSAGIETHPIDGVPVRIYCLEKTVADCFKFRNKIGLDVVIEALKECRTRRDFSIDKLMEFARICRVSNVIRPYLEALF